MSNHNGEDDAEFNDFLALISSSSNNKHKHETPVDNINKATSLNATNNNTTNINTATTPAIIQQPNDYYDDDSNMSDVGDGEVNHNNHELQAADYTNSASQASACLNSPDNMLEPHAFIRAMHPVEVEENALSHSSGEDDQQNLFLMAHTASYSNDIHMNRILELASSLVQSSMKDPSIRHVCNELFERCRVVRRHGLQLCDLLPRLMGPQYEQSDIKTVCDKATHEARQYHERYSVPEPPQPTVAVSKAHIRRRYPARGCRSSQESICQYGHSSICQSCPPTGY